MALKDKIAFGVALPHRSPEPIDMEAVRRVAQRAEALGFRDLWVTENTLDHVFCFDPVVVLTYAAAVTTKIRLGASVVVLPVHNPIHVGHQWASLDYASGGRAILGVGLGRDHHYEQFQTPTEGRVRRFREGVELIKLLWTEPRVDYSGRIFRLADGTMAPKPVQKPHPLDGLRRVEQRLVRPIRADVARGVGEGGARSGGLSDLETRLSVRGRAAGGRPRGTAPLVHGRLSQSRRDRRVWHPRHAGAGPGTT